MSSPDWYHLAREGSRAIRRACDEQRATIPQDWSPDEFLAHCARNNLDPLAAVRRLRELNEDRTAAAAAILALVEAEEAFLSKVCQ